MELNTLFIENINTDNIMFDGSAYVMEEEVDSLDINSFSKYSFDNVINNIVNHFEKEESYKNSSYIHDEITNYLKEKEATKKTIILLQDTGLRGTDKINYNLNSIVCFKISNEIGIGFFVNKTLCNYFIKELNYVSKA